MKKSTVLILVIGAILALGFAGWYLVKPILSDYQQKNLSDARVTKGTITIAVDGWVGYYPIQSKRLKNEMLSRGYLFECINDNADYKKRMEALSDGSIDLAVCTVDAFVLNGASQKYPGYIISVIDQSQGGDAIVGYSDEIGSLDDLRDNTTKKIAFTPDSPSHYLTKVAGVDFDIPLLRSNKTDLKVHSKDSADALKMLKRREVSAAVLWEPEVSKALEIDGVQKLISSDQMSNVIVDVLIVSRRTLGDRPEVVTELLEAYFKVLKHYWDNPDDLKADIAKEQQVSKDVVSQMIKGVRWVTLTENANKWFSVPSAYIAGIRPERSLINTIDQTVSVLIEAEDFKKNPLPDSNPLMLTKSDFIEDLYQSSVKVGFTNIGGESNNTDNSGAFIELSEEQWSRMKDIGTLKVEPIKFSSGSDQITLEGKNIIDTIVKKIERYPKLRIGIRGHTDIRGDKEANRELSQNRAETVKQYMIVAHNIDPNRINAKGFGGERPLSRKPDESNRSYSYRLPRVEIVLLIDGF